MKFIKKSISILLVITIFFSILCVVNFSVDASVTQAAQNYVTDMMNETFVVKSSNPNFNNQTVVYCIPKILLNSADSNKANEEIREKYSSYFDSLRATVDYYNSNYAYSNSYPGFLYENISYEANLYNNILSVCIEHKYENNGYKDYSVYNFDINSGMQLSTSDVASRMKKNNNKINQAVKNQINKYYDSFYSENLNERSKQSLEKNRNNSLCEENLALNKLYIDENNNLIVIYKIFSMAGAELYYYKLDVSTIVCDAINYNLNIEWGKDNFSFENKISDLPLIRLDNGDYNYNMDYSLFNHLDFLPSDILAMKNNLQPCGGVCFGMSVMAFKNATNQLDVDYIENGKNTLYQLSKPKDNGTEKLRNAIGLYQSSCASSKYHNARDKFINLSTHDKLSILYNKLINIEDTRRPILLDYAWISDEAKHNSNEETGVSAHAVLAYGIENEYAPYEINGKRYEYKIWIINPNNSFNSNTDIATASQYCMYLDGDLDEFCIPVGGTRTDSENYYSLTSTANGEMNHLGDAILQFATDDYDLLPSTTSDIGNNAVLTVSNQAAVINGNLISGYNGDDNSIVARSFTPCGQGSSMNLTIDKNAFPEVKTVSDNQTIGYTSDNTSVYITANKDTILKFDDDNINLNNSDGSYQIELAKNNSEFDDILIKGNGNKNEINIKVSSQSLIINGEELSGISIESSDDTLTLDTDENTVIINEENNKIEKFEIIKSGTTGDCTWTLDKNGTLTISGNGAMSDYNSETYSWSAPWRGKDIRNLIIENGVTYIGDMAFDNCENLINITVPESVTNVGTAAFNHTTWYNNQPNGLVYVGKVAYKIKGTIPPETAIVLKNGTKGIATSAFSDCAGLTNIDIPDSVTIIGYNAFSGCVGLTNINIDSVTNLGSGAFTGCTSLESITIGNGVKSIYSGVFQYCTNLRSVKIPNSVTSIGSRAFIGCASLTSIDIPDSVTSIGDSAFSGCIGLTSISIPNGITCISSQLFDGCTSLTNVIIPDSVTSVGWRAFRNCTSLRSVIIPESITSISDEAFGYYCDDNYDVQKVENFTIVGVKNSEAEKYANDNGFIFKEWYSSKIIGDANGDNNIDILDATLAQKYAVGKADLTEEQLTAADVNGDGIVDILDAAEIQKYAVGKITEFKKKA